jgi:phospholipid-binding lipoprotein MlaA
LPRLTAAGALAASMLLASGCATVPKPDSAAPERKSAGQKKDPWERWNRKVFAFNDALDQRVLKPVATGYQKVVPGFVRNMVHNFFGNFEDAWSVVNHLLQGKGQSAFEMFVRVNTNTFFGIGGLFDVASEAGIERQPEDFGQTLGVWGFGSGPYVVWPVLGPSTVRDSIGLPLDRSATPALVLRPDLAGKMELYTAQLVDTRASLLGASKVLDEIALDKYSFVRDAYLARRRSLVYDGNPPDDEAPSREDDDDAAPAPAAAASAPAAAAPAASAASGV